MVNDPNVSLLFVDDSATGKGLGMMFCRMALGDPAKVSSLGQVFAAIMLAQGAVLALGWEPRKTLGRLAECFR